MGDDTIRFPPFPWATVCAMFIVGFMLGSGAGWWRGEQLLWQSAVRAGVATYECQAEGPCDFKWLDFSLDTRP